MLGHDDMAGTGRFVYLCRAVTPGDFVWPALDAARMYDPSVHSVNGQTRVTVEALPVAAPEPVEAAQAPEEPKRRGWWSRALSGS